MEFKKLKSLRFDKIKIWQASLILFVCFLTFYFSILPLSSSFPLIDNLWVNNLVLSVTIFILFLLYMGFFYVFIKIKVEEIKLSEFFSLNCFILIFSNMLLAILGLLSLLSALAYVISVSVFLVVCTGMQVVLSCKYYCSKFQTNYSFFRLVTIITNFLPTMLVLMLYLVV